MEPSFLLQCIFYDRPRLLQDVRARIHSPAELMDYVRNLSSNDPFKPTALKRLERVPMIRQCMSDQGIEWLGLCHAHYPDALAMLTDPPLGLFYLGKTTHLTDIFLGMVGTRRPSLIANDRLKSLLSGIGGYATVSGGALGIDAMVHAESLAMGIPTVAVLASGLDAMTPRTNQGLFQNIIQSGRGCIVSECPPGVVPKPYYFPQRNRLIAALATKLIVIEAAKRSGAVLTATLAAGLGRDVAAVVSGYGAPQSIGCYDLINDGAYAIGNDDGLCEFLGTIHSGRAVVSEDTDILMQVPMEPIHIEELSHKLTVPLDKMIEYVTRLSLNGDVIISSGQMVHRRA
jgi:DNA processing protein